MPNPKKIKTKAGTYEPAKDDGYMIMKWDAKIEPGMLRCYTNDEGWARFFYNSVHKRGRGRICGATCTKSKEKGNNNCYATFPLGSFKGVGLKRSPKKYRAKVEQWTADWQFRNRQDLVKARAARTFIRPSARDILPATEEEFINKVDQILQEQEEEK